MTLSLFSYGLFVFCIFSLVSCLFRFFAHFYWTFCFFWYWIYCNSFWCCWCLPMATSAQQAELYALAAAAAKSLQSCPTLCDPIDGSPSSSAVPEIIQASTLEWVAISFSNAWKWKVKSLSHVWLFVTPWTAAFQAPPSMGFSRQEYWSGLPLPSPYMLLHRLRW